MAESELTRIGQEFGKVYGQDYVFLGYAPGEANAILSMGQDLYAAFPTDYYGTPTSTIPVLSEIRSLQDVAYVFSLSAGFPGLDTWYVYGKEKYGFELGRRECGGQRAQVLPAAQYRPDSGSCWAACGGAAEYETLLNMPGKARAGMDAQSATHFLIIGLIVVCNGLYFLSGRARRGSGRRGA